MPRVSIIINAYNGELTLRETIDSVLAQTFPDWELIAWDDGSTDGTWAVLSAYDDPRIKRYASDRNRGLARARMAALEKATGEWVGFVDQDDLWTPDKLALQLAVADEDPEVGFIYGRALKFFPDGRKLDYDHRHEFAPLPEGDIFERLFVDSCFIAFSTVLFRRRVVATIPPMPPDIHTCPDYFMYLAIAKTHRVAAVQAVVVYYRIHASNMTHTSGVRMQREILQLIDAWSASLPPRLAARRKKVHSTILALHQMQALESLPQGVATLVRDGAWLYLLSRPFARAFRSLRRCLSTPYWRRPHALTPATGAHAR